jgi:hypothetical protein
MILVTIAAGILSSYVLYIVGRNSGAKEVAKALEEHRPKEPRLVPQAIVASIASNPENWTYFLGDAKQMINPKLYNVELGIGVEYYHNCRFPHKVVNAAPTDLTAEEAREIQVEWEKHVANVVATGVNTPALPSALPRQLPPPLPRPHLEVVS